MFPRALCYNRYLQSSGKFGCISLSKAIRLNTSFVETFANRLFLIYQVRAVKIGSLVLAYASIACFSLWLAYQLRFDFFIEGDPVESAFRERIPYVLLWVTLLKLLVLFWFKQYSGLLSYFGTPDIYRLSSADIVMTA